MNTIKMRTYYREHVISSFNNKMSISKYKSVVQLIYIFFFIN